MNSPAVVDFANRVNQISATSRVTFPNGEFIRLANTSTLGRIYHDIQDRYANQMLTIKITNQDGSTPTLKMQPDIYVGPHPARLDDKNAERYHYDPLDVAIRVEDKILSAESYRNFLRVKKENVWLRK